MIFTPNVYGTTIMAGNMKSENMKFRDILCRILASPVEVQVARKKSFKELRRAERAQQPHLHDSWEIKLLPEYSTLLVTPPYTPHDTVTACPLVLRATDSIIKLESYSNLITEVTNQHWAKIFSSLAALLVFYHDKNSENQFQTFHLLFTALCDFYDEHTWEFVTDPRRRDLFDNASMLIERLYIDPDLSVEGIASMLQVTPQHLNRIMQKNSGFSLRTSIIRKRLEKAADFFLNTEYSVVEVAELTGWNSPSYFSLVFKKTYGMSPNAYRKKVRASHSKVI